MDDLIWRHCVQSSTQPEDMLLLDGVEIARLHQRVNDLTWFVTLDQHLDWDFRKQRDCTSYEQGRAGAEMWAKRHEARIRQEIEARRARRRR